MKTKSYKFNSLGLAQAQLDCRLTKQNNLNRVISTAIILGLGITGVITISLLILSLSGTIITIATEHIIK